MFSDSSGVVMTHWLNYAGDVQAWTLKYCTNREIKNEHEKSKSEHSELAGCENLPMNNPVSFPLETDNFIKTITN